MTLLPATLRRYVLEAAVLDDTQAFLRERGANGLEAVVVWVGDVVDDQTARVLHAVRPGQVAYSGEDGCSVEVPPDALSELISMLPPDMFVLARVHTHPGAAYHSTVDDRNMLISHNGAVSIVVPSFARESLDLQTCSVNVLCHGIGWVELSSVEIADRFDVR